VFSAWPARSGSSSMYRYRCSASSRTASVAFGKNAGSGAQQPLVPGEGALVVAHRQARGQVDRHAFALTRSCVIFTRRRLGDMVEVIGQDCQ
jgi:hypothetical protein